jgi:hypothetical protein
MILLAVFHSITEALLACAYLRSRGLSPFLADENLLNINPFYAVALGGIRVLINPYEKAAADLALNDFVRFSSSGDDISVCPVCFSDNVLPEPSEPKDFYVLFRCFDCDHIWDDRHLKNINPGHIE